MKWDEAKKEMLRVLHATEIPFSAIARSINEVFGTSFSRNATIGQAQRLGLDKRINPGNVNTHPKSETPRVRKYTPRRLTFEPSQIPTLFTVTLMDLEPWMCRYPEGDGPMFFCAQPRRMARRTVHFTMRSVMFSPTITDYELNLDHHYREVRERLFSPPHPRPDLPIELIHPSGITGYEASKTAQERASEARRAADKALAEKLKALGERDWLLVGGIFPVNAREDKIPPHLVKRIKHVVAKEFNKTAIDLGLSKTK